MTFDIIPWQAARQSTILEIEIDVSQETMCCTVYVILCMSLQQIIKYSLEKAISENIFLMVLQ